MISHIRRVSLGRGTRRLSGVTTLIACGAGALLALPATAQVTNWTGSVDDNWFNAGNWDNGLPNTALFSAVVGAPSPTDFNGNVTLGGLSVLSGGILNVSDGDNFNFNAAGSLGNAGAINIASNSDFQLLNTVANEGTITVNGTGSVSDLELVNETLVTGSGTILLDGTNARISDSLSAATLFTNGLGHTIRGNGQLGANTIALANNGLIRGDVAGQTLVVDPAGTMTNTGTIRAEAGGILQLSGATYDNTGGTIISAGGQVQLVNASILGGLVTGADIFLPDASNNTNLANLTTEAAILVDVNVDLGVEGTITNNGTITLDGSGAASDIELQGAAATFTGSGTVFLNGVNARINDSSSGTTLLTNGVGHTIRGNGQIGANTITNLVNNGLIKADVAGQTLVVDPVSTMTNTGTIRAEGGGILLLERANYDNTGGTIVSAGGQVRLLNASITGGLVTGGDIFLPNASNNTNLSNLTTEAAILVDVNVDLGVEGTITNNGTITVVGSGLAADIELQDAATLAGNGTVFLNGANARISDSSSAATLFTNGASHTIRGSGNVGFNVIAIVNNGLILADVAGGTMIIDPASTGGLTNTGVLRAEGGATLRLGGGDYTISAGTIEAIGANSSVTAVGATPTYVGRLGTLRAVDGQILLGEEAFGDTTDSNTVYEFSGTTAFTDIFNDEPNGPHIGVGPGGPGDLRSNQFQENRGMFRIGDGVDFTSLIQSVPARNSGTIVAGAGSTFSMGGYDTGPTECTGLPCGPDFQIREFLPLISTGTLAGSGVIKNTNTPGAPFQPIVDADDIISEGFIKPGDHAGQTGTLTLRAQDIFLGDDNVIEIEIAGGLSDSLTLITDTNLVVLNGSVEVSLLGGPLPSVGSGFDIVTAVNGLIGAFDTISLPSLAQGSEWRVEYTPTAVTLSVFLAGDYNEDGYVDAADYTVWRDNEGAPAGALPNDVDGGTIGAAQYATWRANYGIGAGNGSVSIPEPSSILLTLTLLGACRRSRHHRRLP
ncbi:MAG: beta strand repeat-containing protein [Lacipirellulaceae bacterium]